MRSALLLSLFTLLALSPFAQVDFTSSNLPIVVLNTNGQEIPNEPKIDAEMGIIYNGPGSRNYLTDPFNAYDGRIGIELRGSTSLFLSDKKPYAIETRDDEGEDLDVSLLGMPAESDWVLLAPFSDKSLMRDVLTYTLASRTMPWAPRARYCELVLNGEYKGVYAILERIKRDNNRVDIAKLDPDENEGDDLTGGYILKIDKWEGSFNDGFPSEYPPTSNPDGEIFFQYHYPKPEDISEQQKAYIQQFMRQFENVLAADDYANPETGYASIMDPASFVDFFLINEITRNVDGYRLSTFFYKDKDSNGGKLKMGPVWDFNIALGNADYCEAWFASGWANDFNTVCPGDYWQIPFWWERLRQDPAFLALIKNRWQELRPEVFSTATIHGLIDSLGGVLEESQARNFQQWPILGSYVWPNAFVGNTYQEEVDYLKNWLSARLAWMDGAISQLTTGKDTSRHSFFVTAYPNPARHQPALFEFYLERPARIKLELHDSTGRRLGQIQEQLPEGPHQLEWPAAAPGVYFYQFWLNEKHIQSGKLVAL